MEPIEATSLDDLGAVFVVATLQRPDGQPVNLRLRTLSEEAVWELRRKIEWPKPPVRDMTKNGPIYDYQDKGYQDTMVAAERRLANLMVLASLPFDVPGETEDKKLAHLQTRLGGYAHTQLVEAVNQINTVSKEQIADMARSFRAEGASGPSQHVEAQSDPAAVAGAAPV